MKTAILGKDSPILRKIATPVPAAEIGTQKIKNIIERMRQVMHREDDAVAIAAPQIGESLRIFVVSGEALRRAQNINDDNSSDKESTRYPDLVFINPEIVKISKKQRVVEEGCLSVRWLYGKVKRAEKITIRALDEKGRPVLRGASGLLAQIFQHEIDHLNGIIFTDKATDLRELKPTRKKPLEKHG